MGKKGSNKKAPSATTPSRASITLREESTGKKQTSIDAKSMLKLEHIKNLSVWASGEASIVSLSAFFGHRMAAYAEALGTSPDPSLFTCQRCESVLQPGYNCTIRIEKNQSKFRRTSKKSNLSSQNNVVYNCHFCSHRNLIRGTPRGHMKAICPPKVKAPSKPKPAKIIVQKPKNLEHVVVNQMVEVASSDVPKDDSVIEILSVKVGTSLLEGMRRKRNRSGSKKAVETESSFGGIENAEQAMSTSGKRRRKSWTSLKKIVESKENVSRKSLTDLTIPFII